MFQKNSNICEKQLKIKDTSAEDPNILDLVFENNGLSNKEIAVEILNEIDINDSQNGIFCVDAEEFAQKNKKLNQFILNESFKKFCLAKTLNIIYKCYRKKIINYNQPIINILYGHYEKVKLWVFKQLGVSKDEQMEILSKSDIGRINFAEYIKQLLKNK